MVIQQRYTKDVLLEDELGRGFAAVVRFGPYLFVSGADGHRDLQTNQIVPELADKASEQSHNSYGRVVQRLERAGYAGNHAVWIEHFTSGQSWRLARMGLWPQYFGEKEHALAASFGAQARMPGINMMTTVVMAVTPDIERVAVVPQPTPGRASRVTLAGPLVFVIGVRGHQHPTTKAEAPEETADAFDVQLDYSWEALRAHAERAGATLDDYVRVDACIRNPNDVERYWRRTAAKMGGRRSFTGYCVPMPLGARLEQEIGGIAVAPGHRKEVAWDEHRPEVAQATKGGGLVFASGCAGNQDVATGRPLPELCGDRAAQARQALRRLEASLGRFDAELGAVLRLDVFLRDIYFEDEFLRIAREVFGSNAPTMNLIGADLPGSAEIELSAIAGAPDAGSGA
jgi:enamine deaminase RidA (YjgF/YER057c/UK114 family)